MIRSIENARFLIEEEIENLGLASERSSGAKLFTLLMGFEYSHNGDMSTSVSLVEAVFLIEHAGHGSARIEDRWHGGWYHRFLNVMGRWSAKSTRAVPLRSWSDGKEAEAAAIIASKARSRPIVVSSMGGNGLFADQFAAFGKHRAARRRERMKKRGMFMTAKC